MEQLNNNNNISSFDNFTSNVNGFIPLSNDSFCDLHHHQRPQIPFNETSFNPDGPFYDPALLSHFLPTSDEGPSSHEPTIIIKPISESESLIKSSPPIFGDNNKSHRNYVHYFILLFLFILFIIVASIYLILFVFSFYNLCTYVCI